MIICEHEQLSSEWFKARCGLPTASNFDKIVTTKGVRSKSAEKYMYQLAGEKVTGAKEDTYTNAHMERGIALEDEACQLYSFATGNEVEVVGLCYKDENKLVGCSPDGLVGEDGGLEIKCPSLAVHVEYLLNGKLPTTYFQQVQGSLYVTNRKWWSFVSYYPGMKLFHIKVERDEEFIKALDKELGLFCDELNAIVEKIK